MHDMMGFFGMDWWWMWIIMVSYSIGVILLAIWTYGDAKEHLENSIMWAVVVFITMGLGIVAYALIRQPDTRYSPNTKNSYSLRNNSKLTDVSFCERCGEQLAITDKFCLECGKPVG